MSLETYPKMSLVQMKIIANEQRSEIERLRGALKAVLNHWDEFGPEHGLGETIDRVARPALK